MAREHVVRVLPYTPEQLFGLVGDVQRYPDFVPWITAMHTGPVRDTGEGVSELDAETSVGFAFLREAFATRVRRDARARRIEVSLLSGPFRRLQTVWSFRPHPRGCELDFDINFQFKTRVLDALLKANASYAIERLIGCFEDRARALYGAGVTPAAPAAPTRAAALS